MESENKKSKYDNRVKPTDQAEKVLIGKHIRSKDWHNKDWYKVRAFLFFQTSISSKCRERAKKCEDDVLRHLSNSIGLDVSDAIYHGQCESIFLRKNLYLRQTRPNLNTGLDTPRITQ